MLKQIAGLAVAKNEADIIEAMVRHNLSYLDFLHVVDNDSADATTAILAALASEFPGRLTWSKDLRSGHRQTEIINQSLPDLAEMTGAFQIVLLDADEFLRGDPVFVAQTLRTTPTPILLPWVTFVPTESDDRTVPNPVARIIHRRRREVPQYLKTTVPASLIGRARVMEGSHRLRGEGAETAVRADGLTLAHFPVRSRDQLISKILIGAWNLRRRRNRKQNEGHHWLALAERILSGERVTEAHLQAVALGYAAKAEVRLVQDPLPAPAALRYTPSEGSGLWLNLSAFTERCVQLLEERNTDFSTPRLSGAD